MQAIKVNVNRGGAWTFEGFRILLRSPIPLIMIGMFYLLALLVSAAVPFVGQFLPWLLTPVLSVGLMTAARAVDRGQEVPMSGLLRVFGQGFRDRNVLQGLMLLGLANVCAVVIALMSASLFDNGVLFEFVSGQRSSQDPLLGGSATQYASLVFLCVYIPGQMALWYAPALTAWDGISPAKSLFFSFVSVARNKWAFAVYFLTWLVIMMAIAALLRLVMAAFGGSGMLVLALASPILYTALFCSFWPSYRDVFSRPAAAS